MMDRNDIPLGFGFALAQDPEAMKKFASLPRDKQAQLLREAHEASGKEKMEALVNDLSSQG